MNFTERDRTETLVWLEHLGVIQWRVSMTIIASIVKLDVFDLADSTAVMDVGFTLLYSETPSSLVTGNRAICVNISDIAISVGSFLLFFQPRALSLCQHRSFAAPNIFPFSDSDRSVSAGRC